MVRLRSQEGDIVGRANLTTRQIETWDADLEEAFASFATEGIPVLIQEHTSKGEYYSREVIVQMGVETFTDFADAMARIGYHAESEP